MYLTNYIGAGWLHKAVSLTSEQLNYGLRLNHEQYHISFGGMYQLVAPATWPLIRTSKI